MSGFDAGTLARDAGPVVVIDAGSPNVDAGGSSPDGGSPSDDAGSGSDDAGMATVGVPCGAEPSCPTGESCCITRMDGVTMEMCLPDGECTGVTATCDGPEDCASGENCCGARSSGGGFGTTTCTAPDATCQVRLCHSTMDCPAGNTCCPNPFGNGSVCSPFGCF
jgi:hypothetical protein